MNATEATASPETLERELKAYEAHRQELLGRADGKFVLIHGDEIMGTFDAKSDAIAVGYRQLGNTPFLVKQIVAVERPQNFVSSQLAV